MFSRRSFLKISSLAGLSALFAACDRLPEPEWVIGYGIGPRPEPIPWQGSPAERTASHLLKRLTYGPKPGDISRVVEQGAEAFIDEQLSPESIQDRQAYWLVRRVESLNLKTPDIFELSADEAIGDLRRGMLLRAIYSERQLLELMVEFWSDHFNIFAQKADCAWLKVIDDREVIRPHVLGQFRDLLRATSTSPAMLLYLDGQTNIVGKPNENYARELMELHTLGLNGGYTQSDVMELARALTGWRVKNRFWRGQVHFDPAAHDRGAKLVLGKTLKAGDERDLERVIDIVSEHPATAGFLSLKLCRRFVSDDPPAELVGRVARRFRESRGDIRETLRELFRSEEFLNAPPKFKRPYTYAISALRALGVSTDGSQGLQKHLHAMGQLPFDWPTPDGYPEGENHWKAQLLARWNFAFELAEGKIKDTSLDLEALSKAQPATLASSLLQRALTERETRVLNEAGNTSTAMALALCMPDFQYH